MLSIRRARRSTALVDPYPDESPGTASARPSLTVFYRVTAQSNRKPRPDWFSKRNALQSLLRSLGNALPGAHPSLVYLADGGVPAEIEDLVATTGQVVAITGGSAATSFRRLLDVVPAHATPGPGLLWFAEDDYLYRPEAIDRLLSAVQAVPQADYFTLYTPDNTAWHATHPSQPPRRGPQERFDVAGTGWRRTYDSTATFGVRADAFFQDRRLLRLTSMAGSPFDHVGLLATQGISPFSWRHVFSDLYLRPRARALAGAAARPVTRTVINSVVAAGSRTRRVWLAPEQDQATHAEEQFLAPGYDWASHAASLA